MKRYTRSFASLSILSVMILAVGVRSGNAQQAGLPLVQPAAGHVIADDLDIATDSGLSDSSPPLSLEERLALLESEQAATQAKLKAMESAKKSAPPVKYPNLTFVGCVPS